eukprot:1017136-Pyramimonas_sp.AAC.1
MQSLFVDAFEIARELFQVNRDPFHGHSYSSTVLVANVRGMIWTIQLPLGSPTFRSRDRPRGGKDVLRTRIMLTCALPHMTEIPSVAGGATRKTT